MKKTILSIIIVLISVIVYSQDTIQKPRILLRPYFENGINFLRNDILKQNYATQSMYYWGGGLQIGTPDIFKAVPYIQYSLSAFEVNKQISPAQKADSSLNINQISAGLMIPIMQMKKSNVRFRIGYNYSMIKESFYDIDSDSHGFQIGVGAERKILRYSRIYLDLTYNYQKTLKSKSEFRDFDMIKLSVGFVL